jgi:hypothetical protein
LVEAVGAGQLLLDQMEQQQLVVMVAQEQHLQLLALP